MADEIRPSSGSSGSSGSAAPSGSGGGGFFSRKLGPAPMWLWILLGVGGMFALTSLSKGKSPLTNNPSSTFNPGPTSMTAPPVFFLPEGAYSGPSAATAVTAPTTTTPPEHVYGSSGRDLGEYRYGGDELKYISQNMGQYGFNPKLWGDVQQAYQSEYKRYGAATADSMHYSWISPGNVQAIPRNQIEASQTHTKLP